MTLRALLQQQPHWGVGDERARRFKADVNRFAATPDEVVGNLDALTELLQPGDDFVFLLQVPPLVGMPGRRTASRLPSTKAWASKCVRR